MATTTPPSALVQKIANREGIGDLLAEGIKRASEKVGKGSEHFAMHFKGLEMPGYDVRGLKTFALGLAVGTRGACHNRSLAYEVDVKGTVDRFTAEPGRGKIAKEKEDFAAVLDCLVLCKFMRNCFEDFYEDAARIYTMTTGHPHDRCRGAAASRRARLQPQEGLQHPRRAGPRRMTGCPPRVSRTRFPLARARASYVKPEELRMMIDDYYQARGWTPEGLIPKVQADRLGPGGYR